MNVDSGMSSQCFEKIKTCFFLEWDSTFPHRMKKSLVDLPKHGLNRPEGTYYPWKLELHIANIATLV